MQTALFCPTVLKNLVSLVRAHEPHGQFANIEQEQVFRCLLQTNRHKLQFVSGLVDFVFTDFFKGPTIRSDPSSVMIAD